MTERERLIDLILSADISLFGTDKSFAEVYADYLLDNNVIVMPCKVGDTVYILAGHNGHKYEKDICEGFYIGDDEVVQVRVRNTKGNHGTYGVIGETVFLTKEEAEQTLKGIMNK